MIEICRYPDSTGSAALSQLPPLLQRIYQHRGVQQLDDIDHSLPSLLPFDTLLGIEQAVALLSHAIQTQQRIVVVGDFDADGATSCALCVIALKQLGAQYADYLIPNRFEQGYGLSPEVVDQAIGKQADLIMTVDNGISSFQGVAYAKQQGLTVVITDHHLAGDALPEADAIVNPNQPKCPFPSKAIAGVGVAFYVMLALRAHLRQQGCFDQRPQPNLAQLLDLVALGTVADVVPLDKNNRILVKQGLDRMRSGRTRPGILALIEVAKKHQQHLVASDIGFALGPRMNAAGRLEDMSHGVELLLCEDIYLARQMAHELDGLNQARKEIEANMKQEAMALCQKLHFDNDSLPHGIVLYQADWHQGVIGILASRLKDAYHRPVIAFAAADPDQPQNGRLKGSCRSIKQLHIRDTLDIIDKKHPELIGSFGGHAMAAGLTIDQANLTEFKQVFADTVAQQIDVSLLKGSLYSDGTISKDDLTLSTAQLIRQAGPWGQQFPEPLFDGHFNLIQQKIIGENHLKLMLSPVEDQTQQLLLDAIAFNIDLKCWPNPNAKTVHIAYRVDENVFRGQSSLQLMIEHIALA